ncbi:hypothetical protein SeMB42_g02686 [Synchytrium endobioticum]|uniref:U2A'/phosphoprotein 32 family A C-terminal domain-containing protein n=1 Tax=Synchytrium endobioticum TaxID=286115 RepID=A0A507DD36_9FUNG|nr:hypothetical protein SeMB42_g02686 [Synchytrium endobioticum]
MAEVEAAPSMAQDPPADEPSPDAASSDDPSSSIPQSVENEDGPAPLPLTPEIIAPCLSVLARTGNGLGIAYTKLECRGKSITDIDLLRKFTHLKFLDVSDNHIRTLTSLAPLDHLLCMDAKSNAIESVPRDLDARKYLQRCDLSRNRIRAFDLDALRLADFPHLLHLEARGNRLASTGGLSGAPALQRLYLAHNHIDAVVDLDALPRLAVLHLRANKIARLDGFSAANACLATLNLRANQVSDASELDKLACLPALTRLSLGENPLSETNEHYRLEVVFRVPNVTVLDKIDVTPDEREEAASYKEQLEAEKAEAVRLKQEQEEEEASLRKEQEEEEARVKAEAQAVTDGGADGETS